MPLGKPSVSDPRTLDLRALQTAVSNIRQRLEAIEAATLRLQTASASTSSAASTGAGMVTRVAATVPDFLTVSGTPITSTGTLAFDLSTQPTGLVFAGPLAGADAAPSFRALEWSYDLPLYSTESFTSGLTGDEIVLIERYGAFMWTTVRDIASQGTYNDIQMSVSDLTTALATGTSKAYCRVAHAMNDLTVRASLLTVSSSGTVTVDINVNGSTILSTKLTIDANEKTSVTAATPYVLTVTGLSDDDEITIDIDGAGTGAKGLIVTIRGRLV